METFLCLTSLEWTALGAIATFGVSLIALFLPMYQEWKRYNKMIELVQKESEDNIIKIRGANNSQDTQFKTQKETIIKGKIELQIVILEHLSLKNWKEFKYELAINRPKFYNKNFQLFDLIEHLTSLQNEVDSGVNKTLSRFIFQESIKDILDKWSKIENGKIK